MWFSDNIVDIYNSVVNLEYVCGDCGKQILCSVIISVSNLNIITVILVFISFSDPLLHSYRVSGAGKHIEIDLIFYYKHVYCTLNCLQWKQLTSLHIVFCLEENMLILSLTSLLLIWAELNNK